MKALSSTPAGNIVPTANYSSGSYTLTGLIVGKSYYYSMGANDSSIAFASGATFAKTASATGIFTATATSATLSGTGADAVGTAIYPILGVPLYAATVTPSMPTRNVTIGQFPANNPNFSRALQISDEYVFVKRGSYGVAISLADMINIALTEETNLTWTPPVVLTQPSSASCVHSSTAATFTVSAGSEYDLTYSWFELSPLSKSAATLTWGASALAAAGTSLTSNNTNVSDGDTVTIGEKVYTFKTSLTPTEGEVLIGGTADASLLNLIRAINHTGTPDTDYKCAAANTTASADSAVASHAFKIYPKALTTTGIYDVSTAASLVVTPTATTLSGTYYYCTITDDAGSYGLTNGSVTTSSVAITIT
jgi:hypothetical protein